jgi:hypothetical protein
MTETGTDGWVCARCGQHVGSGRYEDLMCRACRLIVRLERELRGRATGLPDAQWQAVQVVWEDLVEGRWSTDVDGMIATRIMDEALRRFPGLWPGRERGIG